jgi:hypothetical protein
VLNPLWLLAYLSLVIHGVLRAPDGAANVKLQTRRPLMPNEKEPFSLFGRTAWEKTRNLAGLALLLGFIASQYIHVNVEQVLIIEIPAADYGIRTKDDLRAAIQAFEPEESSLVAAAKTIQSTALEIKANVALSFALNEGTTPKLLVECKSTWPKEKVYPVCESIGADLQKHLKARKGS